MVSLSSKIVSWPSSYSHLTIPVRQSKIRAPSSPFRRYFLELPHSPASRLPAAGFLRTNGGKKGNLLFMARMGRPEGAGPSPESSVISVFRFTLGIPGFNDSDLPRVLGVVFGGLLILNHALSLNSLTAGQLWSEGVGLILAAISMSLPGIGLQLNERKASLGPDVMLGRKKLFCLAEGLGESQRQDLAWASYTLLRNTSTAALVYFYAFFLFKYSYLVFQYICLTFMLAATTGSEDGFTCNMLFLMDGNTSSTHTAEKFVPTVAPFLHRI